MYKSQFRDNLEVENCHKTTDTQFRKTLTGISTENTKEIRF